MPKHQPTWAQASINRVFDVAASQASDGFQFETVENVKDRRRILKVRVKRASGGSVRLMPCKKDDRCNCAACPICTRRFRRFAAAASLRLAKGASKPIIITIYLADIRLGSLKPSDLRAARARLRTWFDRAGLKGGLAIGGIELAWDARKLITRLHVHLLLINVPETSLVRLRKLLKRANARAVRVDQLRNPRKQISYNLKFGDAHRPRPRKGKSRSRLVPMRGAELVERVRFYQGNPIEAFLFLYGCRRRGTMIARTRK